MSFHKKVVYAFNNFYLNFLTDIKTYNEEFRKHVKRNFKIFDKSSPEYFEAVQRSIQANEGEGINLAVEMMPNLTLGSIIEGVSKSEVNMVKSYFYIFKVMTLIWNDTDEAILEKVLVIIRTIQDNTSTRDQLTNMLADVLDDDLADVLKALVDTLKVDAKEEDNPIHAMFENSKIGSLAKEISEEINIADLNITNPEELLDLRNLTSSNNVLGNIVSKVSDKIQKKISNGSLSQTELINEAMSFIGMLNKDGGSGAGGGNPNPMDILNNPMIADLMKSMGRLGGMGGLGGGKATVDQNKVKNLATRQRLQEKLEKRKQQNKN
jgi:hypothetical protein